MKKIIIIIALLHCALCIVNCQPSTVNRHCASSTVNRVEASFKQTRYAVALTAPVVQTGSFVYIAPDSVLWQYDGASGHSNRTMTLPPAMKSMIRMAVQGDTTTMMQAFDVQQQGNTLTLTPKKKQLQRVFTSLEMVLDKKGAAKQVTMYEPNGDRTVIEFINMTVK